MNTMLNTMLKAILPEPRSVKKQIPVSSTKIVCPV
jgi:hypothetical protein